MQEARHKDNHSGRHKDDEVRSMRRDEARKKPLNKKPKNKKTKAKISFLIFLGFFNVILRKIFKKSFLEVKICWQRSTKTALLRLAKELALSAIGQKSGDVYAGKETRKQPC
jgi:hypothetical protein